MRKFKSIVSLGAPSIVLLWVAFTPGLEPTPGAPSPTTPPTMQQTSGSGGGSFGASGAQRLADAEWYMQRFILLMENGMEPGTAGFHLLRPHEDPQWMIDRTVRTTGGWSWWTGTASLYSASYSVPGIIEAYPETSFRRPFPSSGASYLVIAQGDGLYRIDATFTSSGLDTLDALMGDTDSSDTFLDWFGIQREPGDLVTDMRAVLVSDNNAYLPFSVRDIVLGSGGPTVTVAKDMAQNDAYALVALL